jgi:hypothetical protein
VAIVGIVAGAALAVAALAMEHVCRVKQPPEDDDYRAPHE